MRIALIVLVCWSSAVQSRPRAQNDSNSQQLNLTTTKAQQSESISTPNPGEITGIPTEKNIITPEQTTVIEVNDSNEESDLAEATTTNTPIVRSSTVVTATLSSDVEQQTNTEHI